MEGKNVSALEHNIKSKGEHSYYYAHGRKFENNQTEQGKIIEGPGLITGGEPVLLAKIKKEVEIIKEPKKFTKFIFFDDGETVVMRIELPEEFRDLITDDCVEIKFTDKSFDLRVNVPNGEPYFYSVKKLFKKISSEESKFKLNKGKLSIILKKKEADEEWDKLGA
jgi:HSP20 family molecular chaperone IbpA